jgi:uncharacterized protein (DUF433 family)
MKQDQIDWQMYIHTDPDVLHGKPVVKGTRLSIDFILGLYAAGWSESMILENYPTLSTESLRAVFAFAVECLRDEALFVMPAEAA